LAEEALQLLDPVDQGQHDAAGALAGEPGRAQLGDLVIEPAAQIFLHMAGGAVGDDRAGMIEEAAQQHRQADPDRRQGDRGKAGAGEDPREQRAQQREAGDPETRGKQAKQDRQRDPAAQSAG
jgi:hypothetical protein